MRKKLNTSELLSILVADKKVKVDIGMNWVPDNDIFNFVYPLLAKSDSEENILKFLKQSTSLNVKITNRKPQSWRVYYSGVIENGVGIKKEFKEVDNGYVVNIG